MRNAHVDLIRRNLCSNRPEDQNEALEAARTLFQQISEDAVAALERGPNRFLIAERLNWLGSSCREPLEKILAKGGDEEPRILAALVLLQLGSNAGVMVLLEAIRSGSEYAGLAAAWLAKERVAEATQAILDRLEVCSFGDPDQIVSLVSALRKLGESLPPHLVARFREDAAPWQVRTLMDSESG
ncbi:MAG: hypothetical protein GY835_25130 [bacterium]|nr:hypothetical protein [bacterium]